MFPLTQCAIAPRRCCLHSIFWFSPCTFLSHNASLFTRPPVWRALAFWPTGPRFSWFPQLAAAGLFSIPAFLIRASKHARFSRRLAIASAGLALVATSATALGIGSSGVIGTPAAAIVATDSDQTGDPSTTPAGYAFTAGNRRPAARPPVGGGGPKKNLFPLSLPTDWPRAPTILFVLRKKRGGLPHPAPPPTHTHT